MQLHKLIPVMYVLRYMRESLIAQIRNPAAAFSKRSRAINYGNCYYFQMAELEDLDVLDVDAACDHFNRCYKDPAEFTITLTGQVEVYHCAYSHHLPWLQQFAYAAQRACVCCVVVVVHHGMLPLGAQQYEILPADL